MRDTAFLRIVRFFIALLTILTAVMSILAYIGGHFGDSFPYLSLFGLFQPVLITLNAFFAIYWAARFRILFFLPVIALILSIGYIRAVYRIPQDFPSKDEIKRPSIRICTYNVMGFHHGNKSLTTRIISEYMKERNVDVLCLQEVEPDTSYSRDSIAKAFRYLPFNACAKSEVQGFDLLILSKFPILSSYRIRFKETGNQAMWADILFRGDTIRVFNFHLQTTNFNQAKFSFVPEEWILNLSDEAEKSMSLYQTLTLNFKKRVKQANFIHNKIQETPYPVLLCGDMNSNPTSYIYHQLKGDELQDGFISCGNGYEYTLTGMYHLYRIDYIFHTKDFSGITYQSRMLDFSDHKSILMELGYK